MTETDQTAMPKSLALLELPEPDQRLVTKALEASAQAYAPYSGFAVGAAVRTKGGHIYTGANIENAAYAAVTCAEVSAIAAANAAGDFEIESIAVAGHKFVDPQDSTQVVTPCGRCRQMINEAGELAGTQIQVLSCNGQLTKIVKASIAKLLPAAFGPETLGITGAWPDMKSKLHAAVHRLLSEKPSRS